MMQILETRMKKFGADNPKGVVALKAVKGHFATTHSHINYYIDLTTLKSRSKEARQAACALASYYQTDTAIDTIICIDGTMVLGAYLAQELEAKGLPSTNKHHTIYVIEPENNMNTQLIFRDNIVPMLRGKNVLLLMATISSGISFTKAIRCAEYYDANVVGLASIFSAVPYYQQIPVRTIYTADDIPDYCTYSPVECPMCQAGNKVEAFVNAYGYSQIM